MSDRRGIAEQRTAQRNRARNVAAALIEQDGAWQDVADELADALADHVALERSDALKHYVAMRARGAL